MEQELLRLLLENPFDQQMNYRLLKAEEGVVVLETFADRNLYENSYHAIHGGFLYGLSDTYMGLACLSCGKLVSTMNLSIHYIRPTSLDSLVQGVAEVKHNGTRTMMTVCDFFDEEKRLLAHCEGTFFVLGMSSWKEKRDGAG